MPYQPGDTITLEGSGIFSNGVQCIVIEVHPDDGRILKMKAAIPDERLGKVGFIKEDNDWVAVEWNLTPN